MNRVIPKMKTESGKISFAFQGGKLYNRPKKPKKQTTTKQTTTET